MILQKFTDLLGGKNPAGPPYRIPAQILDDNFSRVKPLQTDGNARQYLVTETPDGWVLEIFPKFPSGSTLHVLGVEGGVLRWVPTNGCAET